MGLQGISLFCALHRFLLKVINDYIFLHLFQLLYQFIRR